MLRHSCLCSALDTNIYVITIYGYETEGFSDPRSRTEEGKRRIADLVAPGIASQARLRDQQADRNAICRRAELQHRLFVSLALPPGKPRMDPRTVGGKTRTAPTALLPTHGGGPKSSARATQQLEGLCGRDRPHCGSALCLTGSRRFAPA